jgi:predicted DNA-binding transcriptional regulator AlpA
MSDVTKPLTINQREIARIYGVTTQQVLRWVQTGEFPLPLKVAGVTRIFRRTDVERWFRLKLDAGAQSSLDASDASVVRS